MDSPKTTDVVMAVASVTLLFFLLASFIIILLMLYQKRKKEYIQEQATKDANFQNQLMQSQIEIQENTFTALGQELHDNIGQLLSSTKMLLGVTEKSYLPIPNSLLVAEETLTKAILDLRNLTKSMNKDWLSQFNLIENLQAETERINAANTIHIQLFHYDNSLPLLADKQVLLFRIIQEALQNCIKHAGATKASMSIINDETSLKVSITDNGNGFSPDDNQKAGVGIMNMQHRTKLLGGTIEWNSAEGNGTEVQINLPIKKEPYEYDNTRCG